MPKTSASFLLRAAMLGVLTVGLGAFGAHGLKAQIAATAKGTEYWDTAVRYALPHAAALAGLAGFARNDGPGSAPLRAAGHCLFFGTLIFSGTLMAMALGATTRLGAVTPIGGSALIAGWALAGFAALRSTRAD